VGRSRRAPLKDDRPYPAAAQFGREPHAHRAAADDGDVVTVHPWAGAATPTLISVMDGSSQPGTDIARYPFKDSVYGYPQWPERVDGHRILGTK
jgi:hypothetical protein